MKCSKCRNYSFSLKRCILGKINPRTLKGGASAIPIVGIGTICKIDKENIARARKMFSIYYKARLQIDRDRVREMAESAGLTMDELIKLIKKHKTKARKTKSSK